MINIDFYKEFQGHQRKTDGNEAKRACKDTLTIIPPHVLQASELRESKPSSTQLKQKFDVKTDEKQPLLCFRNTFVLSFWCCKPSGRNVAYNLCTRQGTHDKFVRKLRVQNGLTGVSKTHGSAYREFFPYITPARPYIYIVLSLEYYNISSGKYYLLFTI
jgi:hypothetical protein